MSSGNWVIDNLNNALKTWNDKLSEIWLLVTQSPTEFKGGGIWNVIVDIHGALQAVGLGSAGTVFRHWCGQNLRQLCGCKVKL